MDINDLGREMLDSPGQSIILELERTSGAIARDGEDRTFSMESIENLSERIRQWILSRIARKSMLEKIAAKRMEVEVTVKLDGEPLDVITTPLILRPISTDGEVRWEILRRGS